MVCRSKLSTIMKVCYSTEPRDRVYVEDYAFLSFTKNIGTHAIKSAKKMSNKYSQELLNSAKKSTTVYEYIQVYNVNSDIGFKTTMLKSNLYGYSDAYIKKE